MKFAGNAIQRGLLAQTAAAPGPAEHGRIAGARAQSLRHARAPAASTRPTSTSTATSRPTTRCTTPTRAATCCSIARWRRRPATAAARQRTRVSSPRSPRLSRATATPRCGRRPSPVSTPRRAGSSSAAASPSPKRASSSSASRPSARTIRKCCSPTCTPAMAGAARASALFGRADTPAFREFVDAGVRDARARTSATRRTATWSGTASARPSACNPDGVFNGAVVELGTTGLGRAVPARRSARRGAREPGAPPRRARCRSRPTVRDASASCSTRARRLAAQLGRRRAGCIESLLGRCGYLAPPLR